jgi:hypothetical protein
LTKEGENDERCKKIASFTTCTFNPKLFELSIQEGRDGRKMHHALEDEKNNRNFFGKLENCTRHTILKIKISEKIGNATSGKQIKWKQKIWINYSEGMTYRFHIAKQMQADTEADLEKDGKNM